MIEGSAIDRARRAFDRKAWAEACRLFEAAHDGSSLGPEDLERLAVAAHLLARDAECERFTEQAHQAYLARGDREGAARSAFWLGFSLFARGALAPASGWQARAEHLLDEGRLDSVVRGYLLIPSAFQRIAQGDAAGSAEIFNQADEIARRFGDRDLASLARHGRGRAEIYLGRVSEGTALLDEAMVAVVAGEVSPVLAGSIYCSVLEACQEMFDLRRAYEWTTSLARWCAAQPDLVRYRGECLLYRAEVLQLRGQWTEAARDARDACELLGSRPSVGAAFYRLGDLHRLRGEFDKAEAAYTRANERGRKPQPGLSLLRLAQGQIEAAAASIRGVLIDTRTRPARTRALAAAVEILLRAGDPAAARATADELSGIADASESSLVAAMAAHASGAVLLDAGEIAGASRSLREACDIWRDLEMPYEEAHTCLLLAAVGERRGDEDGRRLELDSARMLFEKLNARPYLTRLAELASAGTRELAGSLSDREVQVLRLLATGRSNRGIAGELSISEKTVARHVSNIFNKLGVSSRTSAAAWAFQHNLV